MKEPCSWLVEPFKARMLNDDFMVFFMNRQERAKVLWYARFSAYRMLEKTCGVEAGKAFPDIWRLMVRVGKDQLLLPFKERRRYLMRNVRAC